MPVEPEEQDISSSASRPTARPRRRWLGSLIAVLALIALGGLAWYLTHREPARRWPAARRVAALAGAAAADRAAADAARRPAPSGSRSRERWTFRSCSR